MVDQRELAHNLDSLLHAIEAGDPIPRRKIERIAKFINDIKFNEGGLDSENVKRLEKVIQKLRSERDLDRSAKLKIIDELEKGFGGEINPGANIVDHNQELDNVEQDNNVVFLFGAGASHASGIPLVSQLLTELVEQAKRTQNEEFNNLLRECKQREDIGVEDLLTAVYLAEFAVSEASTLNLLKTLLFTEQSVLTFDPLTADQAASERDSPLDDQVETDPTSVNFIQDAIETLFGSIASEMIPSSENQTHSQLKRFIKNHENTAIITTNYDYCIEKELFDEVSINTTLNSIQSDSTSKYEVDLYKMHGSITWTYCDTCQSIDCVEPEKVKNKFHPDGNTLGFPVKGICHICSGERRPLLVPPTSFKFVQFPPLIDIRAGAKEELENADYIIPVGYSFSDEDAYIYKLVWGAMRSNDSAQMIIVDPQAGELANKLRDRFKVQASDFDSERVVAYRGNSEKVMGNLVDQLLPSESSAEGSESIGGAVEESAD